MNLYLIGMMGCGKSTLGRQLAERNRLIFVDLDEEVEHYAHMSVSEIFEKYGEEQFRKLEHDALCEVSVGIGLVVALGGGVPMFENNREVLARTGKCVFIDRSKSDIMSDIDVKDRPLIKDGGFEKLYDDRLATYVNTADFLVKNDDIEGSLQELTEIATNLWDL